MSTFRGVSPEFWHKNTDFLGRFCEGVACAWYLKNGYRLLRHNWRCAAGEADLIFEYQSGLVLIEVKGRLSSPMAGELLFAGINQKKQQRLVRVAEIFAAFYDWGDCEEVKARSLRIDLFGVIVDPGAPEPIRIYCEQAAVEVPYRR